MHDPDRVEYLIQVVGARITPALRDLRLMASRMLVIQLVSTSIIVAICGVTLWVVLHAQ
jgi:hypothetical protein